MHSGDFARRLRSHDFTTACKEFNAFLGALPHKHKIFVAGNHEVAFNNKSKTEIQDALSNCTYLQDDALTVEGHPCEPQLLLVYQLLTQFARCMLYSQV